jgi:hypothetical protein
VCKVVVGGQGGPSWAGWLSVGMVALSVQCGVKRQGGSQVCQVALGAQSGLWVSTSRQSSNSGFKSEATPFTEHS